MGPTVGPPDAARRSPRRADRDVALAELVSRVLERGVVVTGEVVVSVAGVDLLYLGLDVLLAATDRLEGRGRPAGPNGDGADAGADDSPRGRDDA